MTAKLTDDLQRAADAAVGQPLRAEHESSHKVYFIYNEEMHERASIALQEENERNNGDGNRCSPAVKVEAI